MSVPILLMMLKEWVVGYWSTALQEDPEGEFSISINIHPHSLFCLLSYAWQRNFMELCNVKNFFCLIKCEFLLTSPVLCYIFFSVKALEYMTTIVTTSSSIKIENKKTKSWYLYFIHL